MSVDKWQALLKKQGNGQVGVCTGAGMEISGLAVVQQICWGVVHLVSVCSFMGSLIEAFRNACRKFYCGQCDVIESSDS